jgi:hypothetical protein
MGKEGGEFMLEESIGIFADCSLDSSFKVGELDILEICQDRFKNQNQERCAGISIILSRLSKEAKEVIELVFNTPEELLRSSRKKKRAYSNRELTINEIRNYLRYCGWPIKMIDYSLDEIKEAVRNF